MNTLEISFKIGALLVFVMLPLSLLVSARRAKLGKEAGDLSAVAFGDADDLILKRRIRAFGNFIEYVPLGLMMLVLLEYNGASSGLVWLAGIALVAGRLIHAIGLLVTENPIPRMLGMMGTYVSLAMSAIWCCMNFWL